MERLRITEPITIRAVGSIPRITGGYMDESMALGKTRRKGAKVAPAPVRKKHRRR